MSPTAVLQVYQSVTGEMPPPAFLLSIQGLHFELGEGLSPEATHNLQQAISFFRQLHLNPKADNWLRKTHKPAALIC